jgi:molybdate transport repressor ModE-like protein
MKHVSIRPVWTIQDGDSPALPARLVELLVQVQAQGSLLAACQALGMSYRHAWDLVRQGEAQLGTSLLHMERGKGSTLTALGDKLVWADHRIHARLGPVLDSLASELAVEIGRAVASEPPLLRVHASHGFAIEALLERLEQQGLAIERRYGSATAAVSALHDGDCDLASLHIPHGAQQEATLAHYWRWLGTGELQLIDLATRRQGLMVPAGNPKKLYELRDLARPDVHFINREAGSGTRFLLEGLLRAAGLAPEAIAGFERGEYTHAAVAAYVASGMADAGFGLEPPARQFKLDFIPLASERYFLLCRSTSLAMPALQRLIETLRDPGFQAAINALPGYHASDTGRVMPLREAFPELPA